MCLVASGLAGIVVVAVGLAQPAKMASEVAISILTTSVFGFISMVCFGSVLAVSPGTLCALGFVYGDLLIHTVPFSFDPPLVLR